MPGQEDSKVKVQTTRFGELEVSPSSFITFVTGIIGFPGSQRFILLEYNPPFSWLQSVEDSHLAFVVVNAAEFGEPYQVGLPIGDRDLELKDDDDVAVLNFVSIRSGATDTTVNLKAPVIVNLRNMKGKQIILDNPSYSARFPLWSAAQGGEG